MKLVFFFLFLCLGLRLYAHGAEVFKTKGKSFTFIIDQNYYRVGNEIQVLGESGAWTGTGFIKKIKNDVALVELANGEARKGMRLAKMSRNLANTSEVSIENLSIPTQYLIEVQYSKSTYDVVVKEVAFQNLKTDGIEVGPSLRYGLTAAIGASTHLSYKIEQQENTILSVGSLGYNFKSDAQSFNLQQNVFYQWEQSSFILAPYLGAKFGRGSLKSENLQYGVNYEADFIRYTGLAGIRATYYGFDLFAQFEMGKLKSQNEKIGLGTPSLVLPAETKLLNDSDFQAFSAGLGYSF